MNQAHPYARSIALCMTGMAILALPAFGVFGKSQEPKDDTTTPPAPVPAMKGVKVLFGSKVEEMTANWAKHNGEDAAWPVQNGAMVSRGGDIITKEKFTDYQLHVEFKVPYMPDKQGQGRGNSGVFMQGRYEVQLLDSYGKDDPGSGDCAAVYGKAAPLVNACKPPLQWQTYDITFRAPRFDAEGKIVQKARVTVFQNGICVQNNTEIEGPTWGNTFGKLSDPGPIVLQDHGNPMQFRNVWVLPLPLQGANHY